MSNHDVIMNEDGYKHRVVVVGGSLMTGTRAKIEAFVDWAWDGFTKTGGPHVLDRGDAAQINWDDDPTVTASGAAMPATSIGT